LAAVCRQASDESGLHDGHGRRRRAARRRPHADVEQIMGEGIDPHLFKATPDIISRLAQSDVIFYSGLHLEGRMADVFERLAERKPTIASRSGIPVDKLLNIGHDEHDPHVWFDVGLWSLTIDSVEKFLTTFDPAARRRL
jgi:manganese/zinc/iron transport system substrate-binding protein